MTWVIVLHKNLNFRSLFLIFSLFLFFLFSLLSAEHNSSPFASSDDEFTSRISRYPTKIKKVYIFTAQVVKNGGMRSNILILNGFSYKPKLLHLSRRKLLNAKRFERLDSRLAQKIGNK